MPTGDIPYEAFLPQHTPSKHRVMAIARTPGHTDLGAVATVDEALTATPLADAFNSRILGRRKHTQRLNTAFAGLPESVHAAIGREVHVTPHQWRHTFGTRLINNEVPQETVRHLLDHDSHATTSHYARMRASRLSRISSSLAR